MGLMIGGPKYGFIIPIHLFRPSISSSKSPDIRRITTTIGRSHLSRRIQPPFGTQRIESVGDGSFWIGRSGRGIWYEYEWELECKEIGEEEYLAR
jgi:hypothetical protein